ncbi:DUF2147 domain-containing protein [Bradyrhizobium iriomotense]|uniref:DUF2147 domain-containing protein n=1 Tax=Bradyrhizobium iriomotense TaxID=441950 RepID=UPI001FEA7206|nr:DUF2147 domain-containing protein [Bradyrhizobium iriomotense]
MTLAIVIDWRAAQFRWRFLPLRTLFPKSRDICETGERLDRSSHPQTKERSMQTSRLSRRSAIFLLMATVNIGMMPMAHGEAPVPDAIVGTWEADDATVKLDMFKAGAEFQARMLYGNEIVEADNVTFKKDAKNPDPTLRSRSLKNIVFITGLRWENGEWSGGSIYDASSGRTYNCKATVKDGKMHLRGYLGLPAMGQTRTFHRVRG